MKGEFPLRKKRRIIVISLEEYEKYLVNVGEWRNAPSLALNTVKEIESEYGGNIALGLHPHIGWFVLHDQGCGPGLVWAEYVDDDVSLLS